VYVGTTGGGAPFRTCSHQNLDEVRGSLPQSDPETTAGDLPARFTAGHSPLVFLRSFPGSSYSDLQTSYNNNNNTLIYIAPACRMTSEALEAVLAVFKGGYF